MVEKYWREALGNSVAEDSCRDVLEERLVEKCWGSML